MEGSAWFSIQRVRSELLLTRDGAALLFLVKRCNAKLPSQIVEKELAKCSSGSV